MEAQREKNSFKIMKTICSFAKNVEAKIYFTIRENYQRE